ncbi:MAG: DUF3800 domain-containing protein [Romboutsia sp.]|uniref:DUF3800 domain-containing protein n=1 Tax=Romboutsia sp. TaxID=1965302 RepID=UPI003F2C777E
MKYSLFLDESFNTGEPKYSNGKWNFYRQPYFVLGSYSIKDNCIEKFKKEFKDILQKYNNKLGTEVELKSTANYKFKKELLADMIKLIDKYEIDVYIDISNKKYKVVMYLVEYCIYPYYMYNKKNLRTQCKIIADYIYNNLDENKLGEFIELCNNNENISDLNKFLNNLKVCIGDSKIQEKIKEVILHIENYEEKNLQIKNLYPVKDFNNKGTVTSFLPNLDAYNNIIASQSTLLFKSYNKISIYHDTQDQFSNCIKKWTEIMKDDFNINNINNIEFIDSKDEVLIQFIDYITGNIRICFSNIINNSHSKDDREIIGILKPLLTRCNIVSVKSEQEKFFYKLGIRYRNTSVPNIKR